MAKKTRLTYDQGLADGMRALDPISMNKSYLSGYHAGQAARQSQTSREVQQRLREAQAGIGRMALVPKGSKRAHATTKAGTKDLERSLLERLGFVPDEDFILRAQSEWEGFTLDQLRSTEHTMTRQLDKSGGRGVDLADKIDSIRTALALVDSGYLRKGERGVLRAVARKLPKAKLSFDH